MIARRHVHSLAWYMRFVFHIGFAVKSMVLHEAVGAHSHSDAWLCIYDRKLQRRETPTTIRTFLQFIALSPAVTFFC